MRDEDEDYEVVVVEPHSREWSQIFRMAEARKLVVAAIGTEPPAEAREAPDEPPLSPAAQILFDQLRDLSRTNTLVSIPGEKTFDLADLREKLLEAELRLRGGLGSRDAALPRIPRGGADLGGYLPPEIPTLTPSLLPVQTSPTPSSRDEDRKVDLERRQRRKEERRRKAEARRRRKSR